MKKKNKNIYYEMITKDNLYKMWEIIRKTVKNKRLLLLFSLNLGTNIDSIYNSLINKTYKPDKYRTFVIFEPKPRLVMSQTIKDKLVNHFITNYYLMPCLENSLIDENVATRKNKGSKYAMDLMKKYFNRLLINNPGKEIYCLKIDISKYFYSIDHDLLIKMLEKRIKDKDVINLIKLIISETNNNYINDYIKKCNKNNNIDIPLYLNNKGLSIGAMSSQFLGIYYLNEIDHYIKETLGCKNYVRYQDDFVILDTDKERIKENFRLISDKIRKLNLVVNKKSNIFRCSNGFNFLGYRYRVIDNKLKITFCRKTIYKINRKLKKYEKEDKLKLLRAKASYYGYYKAILKLPKINFKISLDEIIKIYKKRYPDRVIIVRNKFYSSIRDGNIFNYDCYINRLLKMRVPFLILSNNCNIKIY